MYKLFQRIVVIVLCFAIFFNSFMQMSFTVYASDIVEIEPADWRPWENLEEDWEELKERWNFVCAGLASALSLKSGDFLTAGDNIVKLGDTLFANAKTDGMLDEIYVSDNGTDSFNDASVKCSTAFIDWLCKELNKYYHGCKKEHYSDFYDSSLGLYSYGDNHRFSWNGTSGSTTTGKTYATYYETTYNKELTYKYPIFGVAHNTTDELTKEKYYIVDFYYYNPLLADKVIQSNDTFSYVGVKDGIAVSTYGNGFIRLSGNIYKYGYRVFSDGHMENMSLSGTNYSSIINYFSPYSYTDNQQIYNGINLSAYWFARNMQFNTSIPIFDSYIDMQRAIRDDDLTEALNFSTVNAFASGYSGKDVTLSAEALNAIRDILNDTSRDIQEKIDDIVSIIGGKIDDTNIGIEKTNGWLEKIYDILKKIYSKIKSIRRWVIADTVIDGADLIVNFLTEIGEFIVDLLKEPVSAIGSIASKVSTLGSYLSKKFPFCIPWDVAFLLDFLKAEPKTPEFTLPLKIETYGIDEEIKISLEDFEIVSKISRLFLTLIFCRGLLDLSFKIVMVKQKEE